MTKVMRQVIALVLKRVEAFVLDFPPAPAHLRQLFMIAFINGDITYPAVPSGYLAVLICQPVFEKIYLRGILATMQWHLIFPATPAWSQASEYHLAKWLPLPGQL